MRCTPNTLVAASAMCLFFACAPPTPPAAEESMSEAEARAIVERMNDEWDAAVVSGGVDAAALQYAEDAVRMEPGLPAMVGREAIRSWLVSEHAEYSFEGSNRIEEVLVLGHDWIMVRSTGTFTATPKSGGDPVQKEESWLSIIKRQPDGTWQWYRDAGSSNLPGQ